MALAVVPTGVRNKDERLVEHHKKAVAAFLTAVTSFYWRQMLTAQPVLGPYERRPVRDFEWLWSRPSQFQQLCRLTIDEATALLQGMGFNLDNPSRGHWKYAARDRFTAFLLSLSDYTRFVRLASDMGWSVASLEDNLAFWLPKCDAYLSTLAGAHIKGWAPAEQAQWRLRPPANLPFPQCIGAVDGWYLRINKPTGFTEAGNYYSQYKRYYALLYLIVIDRTGRIRHMSRPRAPGHTSETSAFLCERIPLLPGLKLLGDGAYTADSRVLIPFAKDELDVQHGVTAAEKRHYNKTLRGHRVRVEWTIGRLRQTWGCLHAWWKRDRGNADAVVRVCAMLLNYAYTNRGLFPPATAPVPEAEQPPIGADDNL